MEDLQTTEYDLVPLDLKDNVVVIMNTNYEDVDLKLHIRQIGVYNHSILRRVMLTNEEGYTLETQDFMVEHNVLTIKAPKMSAMILVRA